MAITHADESNFEESIQDGFVLVDFWGTTCVPCKAFSQVLEDLEAEIPFVNVVKLNTTENPKIAKKYKILSVPTVQFYKDGELKESHVGVMEVDELKEIIAKYLYE